MRRTCRVAEAARKKETTPATTEEQSLGDLQEKTHEMIESLGIQATKGVHFSEKRKRFQLDWGLSPENRGQITVKATGPDDVAAQMKLHRKFQVMARELP